MLSRLTKITKFASLGVVLNISGYFLFVLLVKGFNFEPIVVVTISTPCYVLLAFYLQQKLIFKNTEPKPSKIFRFSGNYILIYLLNISGLFFFVNIMGVNPLIVQGFLILSLGFFNFFLSRILFEG